MSTNPTITPAQIRAGDKIRVEWNTDAGVAFCAVYTALHDEQQAVRAPGAVHYLVQRRIKVPVDLDLPGRAPTFGLLVWTSKTGGRELHRWGHWRANGDDRLYEDHQGLDVPNGRIVSWTPARVVDEAEEDAERIFADLEARVNEMHGSIVTGPDGTAVAIHTDAQVVEWLRWVYADTIQAKGGDS